MAGTPLSVRAPGRVNLIGDHTDYNDGLVLPMAVDRDLRIEFTPHEDAHLYVRSRELGGECTFTAGQDEPPDGPAWGRYLWGVARELHAAGVRVPGARAHIDSDVPVGAGLSSSAALEVAFGFGLARLAGAAMPLRDLALLCQRAENAHAGTHCGIMDPYVICHSRAGAALLLDCRTLEHEHASLRFDIDACIVVCNSMVHHELAGSGYNARRAQCEAGVARLRERRPQVHALRDVDEAAWPDWAAGLDEPLARRCRHVMRENARVQAATHALRAADAGRFGELMYASHESLRDDFEVSCAELDLLVELARSVEGVYGARMTGGGFGGCTVNLVRADAVARFETQVIAGYATATGRAPQVFICRPAGGVSATGPQVSA